MFVNLKNTPLKVIIIAFIIGLFPTISNAFTVNADFVGEQLKWKNAIAAGATPGWTLTDWTPVSGMPQTTKWIPGNFSSQPAVNMTLSGPGGNASIPIEIKGIEYNWTSNPSSIDTNVLSLGPICSTDAIGGSSGIVADDNGAACVSSQQITYPTAIKPFYFIRPIFNLDEEQLALALSGKGSGTYSGTTLLNIRYYYFTSSGALSYMVLSQSFSLIINYQPAILTNVLIYGEQNITPVYNSDNGTVSGSTSFNVIASGMFPNGITLTFEDRDYKMKNEASGTYIPYSIVCSTCIDNQIVLNGNYQLASTDTSIPVSGNINTINFNLDVSYTDVAAETLSNESATYRDIITITFKETL